MSGTLYLLPWHIGCWLDVTLNVVRLARRLTLFLAEDPESTRSEFETQLKIDCRGKRFLRVPAREDPLFLAEVRAALRRSDAGLIASGGTPCFIDPGAWLVSRLRAGPGRARILSLPGASVFSSVLALSGVEWSSGSARGSFAFFREEEPWALVETVGREHEPVFIFLAVGSFRDCLRAIKPVIGRRLITAFFDISKGPASERFAYADLTPTRSCAAWLAWAERARWGAVSDVTVMIHARDEKT